MRVGSPDTPGLNKQGVALQRQAHRQLHWSLQLQLLDWQGKESYREKKPEKPRRPLKGTETFPVRVRADAPIGFVVCQDLIKRVLSLPSIHHKLLPGWTVIQRIVERTLPINLTGNYENLQLHRAA